jgi:hypothetical protein
MSEGVTVQNSYSVVSHAQSLLKGKWKISTKLKGHTITAIMYINICIIVIFVIICAEVLTEVTTKSSVFWDVTPCTLVEVLLCLLLAWLSL